MMKRLMVICSVLLLSACATGTRITEFNDRSVGYGWLDIKDVDANRLHAVNIYQFRPQTSEPYFPTTLRAFKNGYLYYSYVLPNGSHKTISAVGQQCLGIICGNTIYEYSFGKQGDDVGAVIIKSPGVYSLGSYKLKEVKTGFFEQGKFDAVSADNAPSKREMLEEILKDMADVPVIAERIKRELANLK
jgi:hypothetical protein